MKIRIKHYSLKLVLTILFLIPPQGVYGIGLGRLFNFGYIVCVALWLPCITREIWSVIKYKRYKEVDAFWILCCYSLICLVTTAANGKSIIELVLLYARISASVLILICAFKHNPKQFIQSAELYFVSCIIINFVIVIMFPNGMYIEASPFENYIVKEKKWLFGHKNQTIQFVPLALLASSVREGYSKEKVVDFRFLFIAVISFLSCLLCSSRTSVITLFFLLLCDLLYYLSMKHSIINLKIIIPVLAIVCLMLVIGNNDSFYSAVALATGKDTSFTGRRFIWSTTLQLISINPLIGIGYTSGNDLAHIFGGFSMRSTHNTFLQVLLDGGILLFFPFAIALIKCVKSILHNNNRKLRFHMSLIFVMFFIECMFESWSRSTSFWVINMLFIHFNSGFVASGRANEDCCEFTAEYPQKVP